VIELLHFLLKFQNFGRQGGDLCESYDRSLRSNLLMVGATMLLRYDETALSSFRYTRCSESIILSTSLRIALRSPAVGI